MWCQLNRLNGGIGRSDGLLTANGLMAAAWCCGSFVFLKVGFYSKFKLLNKYFFKR